MTTTKVSMSKATRRSDHEQRVLARWADDGGRVAGLARITEYLEQDHERLRALLSQACEGGAALDLAAFARFRTGLLRHIGIEEKVLFPAARRANGGTAVAGAAELRVEHAALSSMLVPTPDLALAREIAALAAQHDETEERPGGVYSVCEALFTVAESAALLATARAFPSVRVAPHFDGPPCYRTAREALGAARRKAEKKSGMPLR